MLIMRTLAIIGVGVVVFLVAVFVGDFLDDTRFPTRTQVIAGAATFGAFLVAAIQLAAYRRERRAWATLQACERYETDPEIRRAVERLVVPRSANPKGESEDPQYAEKLERIAAVQLLNYFEGLAIGEKQDFYDRKILQEHLGKIIEDWIEALVRGKDADHKGRSVSVPILISPDHYYESELRKMERRWQRGW